MTRVLLLSLGLFGHFAFWISAYNRFSAINFPKRVLKLGEVCMALALVGLPLLIVPSFVRSRSNWTQWSGPAFAETYVALCAAFASVWLSRYLIMQWYSTRIPVSYCSRIMTLQGSDTEPLAAGRLAALLSLFPGNQILQLEINEKEIHIADLDEALDGLTVVHFSDLHFTGRMTRAFYRHVVDVVQGLNADLIALTGDVLDKEKCLDWIEPILGNLAAEHRVYFVLGNHEKKAALVPEVRQRLEKAGLISVGGKAVVERLRGQNVLLAGNELPWIKPVPNNFPSDVSLKIALLHTPDQLQWARSNRFDLVLAGHTHGGQVRLPGGIAVLCPSLLGTRYASGVFVERPSTMHVTRGISGYYPIRLWCRPEITKLVLRRATAAAK